MELNGPPSRPLLLPIENRGNGRSRNGEIRRPAGLSSDPKICLKINSNLLQTVSIRPSDLKKNMV